MRSGQTAKQIDKSCRKCSTPLNSQNWTEYLKKNHMNICTPCRRIEHLAYAKAWRARHPGRSNLNALASKKRIRQSDPVLARGRAAYNDSRKRAIAKGMEFSLTSEMVVRLMRDTPCCPYFGWSLTHAADKAKTTASLDRIDSTKGYTLANVRVISYLANVMKSSATHDELIEFARGILKDAAEKMTNSEGNR